MGMSDADFGGAMPVDGYGPGFFRVGGRVVRGPVIVAAGLVRPWGGLDDVETLMTLAGSTDLVFVGMGTDIGRLPQALTETLQSAGLMVEAMATPTAARSYNVTLSEGRRVACALIPV